MWAIAPTMFRHISTYGAAPAARTGGGACCADTPAGPALLLCGGTAPAQAPEPRASVAACALPQLHWAALPTDAHVCDQRHWDVHALPDPGPFPALLPDPAGAGLLLLGAGPRSCVFAWQLRAPGPDFRDVLPVPDAPPPAPDAAGEAGLHWRPENVAGRAILRFAVAQWDAAPVTIGLRAARGGGRAGYYVTLGPVRCWIRRADIGEADRVVAEAPGLSAGQWASAGAEPCEGERAAAGVPARAEVCAGDQRLLQFWVRVAGDCAGPETLCVGLEGAGQALMTTKTDQPLRPVQVGYGGAAAGSAWRVWAAGDPGVHRWWPLLQDPVDDAPRPRWGHSAVAGPARGVWVFGGHVAGAPAVNTAGLCASRRRREGSRVLFPSRCSESSP